MRKLLNTVYIMQDDMYLFKEGETLRVEQKGSKIIQLPIHNIEGIVILGNSTVTPTLLNLCSERAVKVSFISKTGKFLVSLQNPIKGNVHLRKAQYALSEDNEGRLNISKNFVMGKIFNCKCILQRLLRDHGDKVQKNLVQAVIKQLFSSIQAIENTSNLDSLRGIEGEAAKNYYQVFNELILNREQNIVFKGRSRRPPRDEVNALLSFFYTFLAHECTSALETVGLDPQVGFFHKLRAGRQSLSLDMMEELRPYIVDRLVITMINNRQIGLSDFVKKENGAILLKEETRKTVIQIWQNRKQEIIKHPFLKENLEIGLIPYAQALLMARFVRGDLDGYPPFLMR